MSFANGLKTIVVATALSGQAEALNGQSEAALEYARKLAASYGARIVLAHGLDPLEYAAVNALPGKVRTSLSEDAKKVLDQLTADLIQEGIHSHSEIRQGAIALMLLDVARQYDAGLIVIGTKGMQGAGPVVVGAIAEQLVRQSTCPVLAVAADWNAGPHRPTPGGPVLLAMEQNDATPAAVATAYSLAATFKRPLLAVHARTAAEAAAFLNPCTVTLEQFGVKSSQAVPVRCMVKDGTPSDAMSAAITQHQPCILVAGVKRASATPGPHGTAFALLASSRVPVLCVPPEKVSRSRDREVAIPAQAV